MTLRNWPLLCMIIVVTASLLLSTIPSLAWNMLKPFLLSGSRATFRHSAKSAYLLLKKGLSQPLTAFSFRPEPLLRLQPKRRFFAHFHLNHLSFLNQLFKFAMKLKSCFSIPVTAFTITANFRICLHIHRQAVNVIT